MGRIWGSPPSHWMTHTQLAPYFYFVTLFSTPGDKILDVEADLYFATKPEEGLRKMSSWSEQGCDKEMKKTSMRAFWRPTLYFLSQGLLILIKEPS